MRTVTQWVRAIGVDDDGGVARRRLRDAGRLRAAGRVMSLRTVAGRIEGRVQGSHARPHLVELSVAVWTDEQWRSVGDLLGRQARHYARLLAGQLPDQFDVALTELGLSLVPEAGEWRLHCTCTEPTPCTHQLAVWLDVRERLEDDPYLITRLRGRSREQLLAEIRDQRDGEDGETIPLASVSDDAWSRPRVHASEIPLPPVRRTTTPAGALQILGDPPGWSGPQTPAALFGPAIVAAADRARRLLDDDGAESPRSGDVL